MCCHHAGLCRLLPWALTTLGSTAAFSLLALGVCTAFTVHAPLLAWCASFLKGPSASTGLAVIKVMAGLGAFTGPAAIGVIRQHHALAYVAALWFVSITLVAAAGLCLGAWVVLHVVQPLTFCHSHAPGCCARRGCCSMNFVTLKLSSFNCCQNCHSPSPTWAQRQAGQLLTRHSVHPSLNVLNRFCIVAVHGHG